MIKYSLTLHANEKKTFPWHFIILLNQQFCFVLLTTLCIITKYHQEIKGIVSQYKA